MLIAPYSTDAPIYHAPIATGVIIFVNVIVYFGTMFQVLLGKIEFESVQWLTLCFDQVNPLQWITAAFMHGDPMHLIGNMIFLWAFGLVVEGKVGWKYFSLIYLAIALCHMAMIQIPMFAMGSDGVGLGASGVIFGLMVIAAIWAPENEMDCFYWIGLVWWGTFEIRLITLGAIYIGLQIFMIWLSDFQMSGAMGQMSGVVVGAPIAFYMLRKDWVDCEGWDLVSRSPWLQSMPILTGPDQNKKRSRANREIHDPVSEALAMEGVSPTKRQRRSQPVDDEALPSRSPVHQPASQKQRPTPHAAHQGRNNVQAAKRANANPEFNGFAYQVRSAIQSSDVVAAHQAFVRMDQKKLAIGLSDKLLFQFISLLCQNERWVDALRPLNIIASRGGSHVDDARLRIAQIQLKVLKNPNAAIRTLSNFTPLTDESTPTQKQRFAKRNELVARAQKLAQQI